MRYTRRQYAKTISAIGMGSMVGVAGCLGSDEEETEEELWHDKPQWNEGYEQSMELVLENSEDNINIDVVEYGGTDEYQAAIRPVFGTDDGPALFSWWVGSRLEQLVEDGYAYDLSDVWEGYLEDGAYDEATLEEFGVDGTPYGVPSYTAYYGVWYKQSVFDDYGFEEPETMEEFEQLCDEISGEGMRPIIADLDSWVAFLWWAELVIGQDPDFYEELCAGNASYTDEVSVNAMEIIGNWVENGYFGEVDALFDLDDGEDLMEMEQERAGLLLIGDWISAGFLDLDLDFDEYSWFTVPPINEEVGNYAVVEGAPHVLHDRGIGDEDKLDQVADVMLSEEFQEEWCQALDFIPANQNVDAEFLPESKQEMVDEYLGGDYTIATRFWENAHQEVAPNVATALQELYTDPDSVEEVAQNCEDIRADVHED